VEIVEKSKTNPFMRDLLTEATPFEIKQDGTIVYHREFVNSEQLRPNKIMQENPDAMRKLTTHGATSSED
jgi:hypothetical protein